MTIKEKRKLVTGYCADMESCESCPCLRIGTCYNKAILCLYDEKRLDSMINAFQTLEPPDKEVEQELAECEDKENEKADLVDLANAYCRMIPEEYCDTEKIAPCAMCGATQFDFEYWTEEDLEKFIDECRKLSADGFFKEKSDDYDTVERPKHYASTSIECIDAMRETQGVEAVKSFCVCNAFKYLWRHNNKNGDEDIRKASWYLNKAVELMGDKHEN